MILDHCCIKGTDESSLAMDSSVPLMNYVSDLGSLSVIQIIPKESTQSVIKIDFRNSKQKDTQRKQSSMYREVHDGISRL